MHFKHTHQHILPSGNQNQVLYLQIIFSSIQTSMIIRFQFLNITQQIPMFPEPFRGIIPPFDAKQKKDSVFIIAVSDNLSGHTTDYGIRWHIFCHYSTGKHHCPIPNTNAPHQKKRLRLSRHHCLFPQISFFPYQQTPTHQTFGGWQK